MFLVVQLGLVVISSTDQILIATLFVPAYVVEYQAYLKIFGMVSMVFSLLTQPLWSAVAVARARGDVAWIARASRALLRVAALCSLGCVAVVGALPWIFDIWLGPGAIAVSYMTAAVFAMLATADVFLLAVTCIANGLGELRTQVAFTVLGAIVKVPLTLLFIELFGHWVFVVLAHALAIAPLVVVQGVVLRRRLSIRALRASSTAVE